MKHPVLDTKVVRNSSVEDIVDKRTVFIHDLLVCVRARNSTLVFWWLLLASDAAVII